MYIYTYIYIFKYIYMYLGIKVCMCLRCLHVTESLNCNALSVLMPLTAPHGMPSVCVSTVSICVSELSRCKGVEVAMLCWHAAK